MFECYQKNIVLANLGDSLKYFGFTTIFHKIVRLCLYKDLFSEWHRLR